MIDVENIKEKLVNFHRIYKIHSSGMRRKIKESDYYKLDGDYVYGFNTSKGIIDKNTLA